jgi:N-acetylmuramoyl-L-alanine amidase
MLLMNGAPNKPLPESGSHYSKAPTCRNFRSQLAGPARLLAWLLILTLRLHPVLAQNEASQVVAAQYLVVIDPGHGGGDAGASGLQSSSLEKTLALDLALRLGKLLQAEGNIAVAFTRNSDVSLEPARRAEIANYSQGTLLVSLHAGASNNPESGGARVFYFAKSPGQDQPPEAAATGIPSRSPARALNPDRAPALRLIPWERAHEPYDVQSHRLATSIQETLNALYATPYSASPAPLYLLKSAQMPAVLVELGYLTNKEDDDRLQQFDFQQRLLQVLRDGIINYLASPLRVNRSEH